MLFDETISIVLPTLSSSYPQSLTFQTFLPGFPIPLAQQPAVLTAQLSQEVKF